MSEEQGFIQRGSELWELAQDYFDDPGRTPNKQLEAWEQELRLWDKDDPDSEPSPVAIARLVEWDRRRSGGAR